MIRELRAVFVAALTFFATTAAVQVVAQADPNPPAPAPNFEIIVVPDTQYYSLSSHTEKFMAQGQFIADRQPAFALHVGDIVHRPRLEEQWVVADAAWDLVDAANVPYSVAFGNHDGILDRDTALYNQYFGTARYASYPWYGGHLGEGNENHYQLLTAGGIRFVVISIAWDRSPELNVLEWADSLLKQHPDRVGIVVSHELLRQDGTWAPGGEDIYDALKVNSNLRMMFAGHYTGDRFRSDTFEGNTVHTMMVDYQHTTGRGNGFLRLLDVNPNTGVVNATTYSPFLDEYMVTERAQYSFQVDFATAPTVEPDSAITAADITVSIPVTANDLAGHTRTLDTSSVALQDPASGALVQSVDLAGEGTFSVIENGVVLFDPEPQFAGNAKTIHYQVADSQGAVGTSTIDVEVVPDPPSLVPDSATTSADVTVSIDLLANDVPGIGRSLLPNSAVLVDPAGAERTAFETAEGSYSVTDGVLIFNPIAPFAGSTNTLTYRVRDDVDQIAESTVVFTVIPDQPKALPDSRSGEAGQVLTIDVVANDLPGIGRTLQKGSLQLLDEISGQFQSTLTIPDVGVFTTSDGSVIFDPETSFHGPTDAITYRITDDLGQPARAEVIASIVPDSPEANPDFEATSANQTVEAAVIQNDAPGVGRTLILDSVALIDPVSGNATSSFSVPDVGGFTIAAGTVTFDPETSFAGQTAVTYRWVDDLGQPASAILTIDVTPDPPEASPDSRSTPAATRLEIEVSDNDSAGIGRTLVPKSTRLQDPASGLFETSVTIEDEGVFSVTDGLVIFDPEPAFAGQATVMTYIVLDDLGQVASSTLSINVIPDPPKAEPDTAVANPDETISIDVMANDSAGIGRSLSRSATVLLDPDDGSPRIELDLADEGTYTMDNGILTFNPTSSFAGLGTPLTYRIADDLAQTTTASVQIAVLSVEPTAFPDAAFTDANVTVTVDVLANDLPGPGRSLVASSIRIQDPDDGVFKTSVSITNEGVYTRGSTGTITFNPTTSFAGEGTSVIYRVSDDLGLTATTTFSATVVAALPIAAPDFETTNATTPVTVGVLANDAAGVGRSLRADTVRLLDPTDGLFKSTVEVHGEGTYTAGPGEVTFSSQANFVGQTTPMVYRVADDLGQTATSSLLLEISAPPPIGPPELDVAVSSTTGGTVPFNFADEDIVSFTANDEQLIFNGSEFGINVDIDAFERLPDGSVLTSLKSGSYVQGNYYDDSDVIHVAPSGFATMYFDGSTVGLTTASEDIDAVSLLPSGGLLISTAGGSTTSAGSLDDSDILLFANGQLSLYLRGADFGLTTSYEDIAGISVAADGSLYIATPSTYVLSEGRGNGRRGDVIRLIPGPDGFDVADPVAWSGSDFGWSGETLDSLSVQHLN